MIDLKDLEKYRENNRIEAKRALYGFPHSFWETYSSFANTMGGIILLGVEEAPDTSLHAIDLPNRDELVKTFWQTVVDKEKVSAVILTEKDVQKVDYEGKRILVVTVPRAERADRPVYIGGDPYTGTYRRNGEGDYRCPKKIICAMLRDSRKKSADMTVLNGVRLSALDFEAVKDYRLRLAIAEGDQTGKLTDCGFLKRVGAAAKAKDGRLHPTVAGLLTFGKSDCIKRIFNDFSLEYRDTTCPANDLPPTSSECANLYLYFFAVCERLQRAAAGSAVYNALREALANCVTNADYRLQGGICVTLYENGISFKNPGSFGTNLKNAKRGGVSEPRNAGIKKLFARFGVGEGSGSGLPNIYALWRRKGWSTPQLYEGFDPDCVTLSLKFSEGENALPAPYSLSGALIIQLITEKRAVTEEEIFSAINLPENDVRSVLHYLCSARIIRLSGDRYLLYR